MAAELAGSVADDDGPAEDVAADDAADPEEDAGAAAEEAAAVEEGTPAEEPATAELPGVAWEGVPVEDATTADVDGAAVALDGGSAPLDAGLPEPALDVPEDALPEADAPRDVMAALVPAMAEVAGPEVVAGGGLDERAGSPLSPTCRPLPSKALPAQPAPRTATKRPRHAQQPAVPSRMASDATTGPSLPPLPGVHWEWTADPRGV